MSSQIAQEVLKRFPPVFFNLYPPPIKDPDPDKLEPFTVFTILDKATSNE